jgi:hypothetical protein
MGDRAIEIGLPIVREFDIPPLTRDEPRFLLFAHRPILFHDTSTLTNCQLLERSKAHELPPVKPYGAILLTVVNPRDLTMTTTQTLLNEAYEASGVPDWASLAKRWKISDAALSRYRKGTRIVDDYAAARIADELKIERYDVMALANAEREKDPARVRYWRKTIKRVAALLPLVITAAYNGITAVEYIICKKPRQYPTPS